jgi:glycosyltransferase involved in cell wall biosynthesis
MRVVLDHQAFCYQRFGGVSRYFAELAARLCYSAEPQVDVFAGFHMNEHLRHGAAPVRGVYLPAIPHTARVRDVLNRAALAAYLRVRPADVVHETYFAPRRPAMRGGRTVVTVFDMIHELFPGEFPRHDRTAQWKAAAVARADHVICISASTKRDLVGILHRDPADISVIYLASSLGEPTAASAKEYPDDAPGQSGAGAGAGAPVAGAYLLYVGLRGGYKNFELLLRALAVRPALRELRLVCVGGGAFTAEERGRAAELGLADRVVYRQGGDTMLRTAYRHAVALVYPSRYEGFGIPPLEAMELGCPVVCGAAASLPEVVGDAAELVDVTELDSLAAGIERVAGDGAHAAELRRRGRARAALFSWDRCADETAAVYRSLM